MIITTSKVRTGAEVVSLGGTRGTVEKLKEWGRIAEVMTAFGLMEFRVADLIVA